MLSSGDVVGLDLGLPEGSEAGLRRPAVVLTANRVLRRSPSVIHVVPLTRTLRDYATEIRVEPDPDNGLTAPSAAQCQHIRAVSAARVDASLGNVGPVILAQCRQTLTILLDL